MTNKIIVTLLCLSGAFLAVAGLYYAVTKESALLGPLLIVISIVITSMMVKVSGSIGATSRTQSNKSLNLSMVGDMLLFLGLLGGVVTINFLNMPTKQDRAIALSVPALLFFAGILLKLLFYLRGLGRKNQ